MKILAVSDSVTINTGFSRVMRSILPELVEAGHEVVMVGWGYEGEEHNFPFKILPCVTNRDGYGEDIVAQYIRNNKPDILFTLGEPWALEWTAGLEEKQAVCHVGYFPIDGHPIPLEWHDWIKSIDVPVVMSKYAYNLVKDVIGKNPFYLPHGVDTELFKPLESKKALRKEILGIDDDMFIVGCVARNQPRKNLPTLMKAFANFASDKDDVGLYLHSQIRDVGWNLDELAHRYGIIDKTYATDSFTALHGVPDDHLVKIYNLFDVMALPSMAEGFGLPILESQSCGVPVLVTDFSACTELVANPNELIKVQTTLVMGRGIEQAVADTEDLTKKLKLYYNNWKKKDSAMLIQYGQQGRVNALELDWQKVNASFLSLLQRLEPEVKKVDKKIRPTFYTL